MANYSRKMVEQIPDLPELQTLLNPVIVNIVQSYAPPMTRTINGHSLENDIVLTAVDVGARPNTWFPTPTEIGAMDRRPEAVEDNFVAFDRVGNSKDSGKNANSFLPAKYTDLDYTEVLYVDSTGTVQSTPQETLLDFLRPYSATKAYREHEVFYYTDPQEGLGIFITSVPHEAEGFDANHNVLIAKVGMSNSYLNPSLTSPLNNANYTLTGSLQQLLQGLLNNVKNLQDRVEAIEDDYVRSDTPRVKLNISSTPSTPQTGYYIVRIDPAEILD